MRLRNPSVCPLIGRIVGEIQVCFTESLRGKVLDLIVGFTLELSRTLSSWAQRPQGFSCFGEQSWFYRERWLTACTSSNILWQPVWSHKFSTERLKIFKCTWIKYLLETNLASCVKPTKMRPVHFTYVCFRLQVEKVKIYPDIPYVLPKSYSKLAADRPTVSENVKTVECQVTEEPASTMGFFGKMLI